MLRVLIPYMSAWIGSMLLHTLNINEYISFVLNVTYSIMCRLKIYNIHKTMAKGHKEKIVKSGDTKLHKSSIAS